MSELVVFFIPVAPLKLAAGLSTCQAVIARTLNPFHIPTPPFFYIVLGVPVFLLLRVSLWFLADMFVLFLPLLADASQADMRLVDELSLLSSLPAALSERLSARPEGSSPPLVIVYLSSLKVRSGSTRCAAQIRRRADESGGWYMVVVGAAASFYPCYCFIL